MDSNVIVRYVVQDDEQQALLATKLIEKECTSDKPGFISQIVLCETMWVLKSCYAASKERLVFLIETLLQVKQLQLEHPDIVWQALRLFKTSRADFSDVLLCELNKNLYECQYTATFDIKASELPEVRLIID